MDFEDSTVCEKIINDIDAIFHKDPDLCTFDIIHLPSNQNKNKSPVIHEQNNLGLESWCVQHVYEHAHKTILAQRQPFRRQENGKFVYVTEQQLLKYLNSAILINPDVATYWNLRRKLFVKNRLNITKEFQFSSIVLTKKPKSNEAFFYRRWLFSFQSGESIDWTFELGLCERCADKNTSNYHAWSHRQWVLQKAPSLLKYEVRFTEKFIRKHISDYSGYNHRQHMLLKLLETGFYDEHQSISDYSSLCEFVKSNSKAQLNTVDDLVRLFGNGFSFDHKVKTKLYCLNIAAHDLQLCAELTNMYGYRESFNCHRKAVLKFIVDQIVGGQRIVTGTPPEELPPQMKIAKADTERNDELSDLLTGIKGAEGLLGELHRRWCTIFLGFDYSDAIVLNEI